MRYYFGIDIGGSKIKAVLLKNLNRQKPKLFVIDTPRNRKIFLQKVEALILKVAAGKPLTGIGAGVPGIFDAKMGLLIKAPNTQFLNGWNVRIFLKKFAGAVRIDNDSRCFLRGEASWGAARGYKNVLGVAIGTGVGGGIMVDGKMYYGASNGAGEWGHTIIQIKSSPPKANPPQAEKFKVQSYGWEKLVGKKAFLKYGDRSEIVGIGVANLVNVFDPDAVILGGGGVTSGSIRLDKVRHIARRYVISPFGKKTLIIKGRLGDAAAAIGAALLFKEKAA